MPGSYNNPVKLDHYQNIIGVGWPSRGTPTYIVSAARFTNDYTGVITDSEEGDDGFIYPDAPPGYGGGWTVSAQIDFHNTIYSGAYSPLYRYNSFDIYDEEGDWIETADSSLVSAPFSMPKITSFSRFECFIEIGRAPSTLDWSGVGSVADPLFPTFMTGSALLNFSEVTDFSGPEEKYSISGGTPYVHLRAASSGAARSAGDFTLQSATYLGQSYSAIGVRLIEGPGFQPGDYLQATVLLKRQ